MVSFGCLFSFGRGLFPFVLRVLDLLLGVVGRGLLFLGVGRGLFLGGGGVGRGLFFDVEVGRGLLTAVAVPVLPLAALSRAFILGPSTALMVFIKGWCP